MQNGVAVELARKSADADFDILERRNPHRLMDADGGRDGSQRGQSVADAVRSAHDAAVDQHSEQKSDIEHQLHQRQQDDRAERPVEEDDHRTWKLRREYRARRELAPAVKLQCDQRERRHHDLDRERQLQRPDDAGQDQEIDQAEYELGNRFAPDLTRCGVSYTNSSTNSTRISFGQDAGQAASSARSGAQPSRLRFMRFSRWPVALASHSARWCVSSSIP